MKLRIVLSALVAGLLACGSVQASPVTNVVYDSTASEADGAAQLSTNGVSSWNFGAQQFNSGNNSALFSVALSLFRIGSGGSYSVQLWSNGVNGPGSFLAVLGSGSTSSLSSSPSPVTFNHTTAINSNTDYWVVFDATSVGPGQAYWNFTGNSTGTGVGSTAFFKTNDGDGWTEAYGEYRGIMAVQAVPEPSTYALAAVGLGIAGFVRARRRKAAV